MKNFIILILSILTIQNCCAQASEKLVVDEAAKKVFSSKELKGIKEMIKFVDDVVSDSTNVADMNQTYHTYFDKCRSYVDEGRSLPTLLKDSIKYNYLETMNKDAFEAIWRMNDHARRINYKDTVLTDVQGFKTLVLNYQGKYLKYLKEIGKTDSRYAGIYESTENAGDISPATVGWFVMNYQEFDFAIFKDRLWATVFLLRWGDPLEEKVERYLKGKNN